MDTRSIFSNNFVTKFTTTINSVLLTDYSSILCLNNEFFVLHIFLFPLNTIHNYKSAVGNQFTTNSENIPRFDYLDAI